MLYQRSFPPKAKQACHILASVLQALLNVNNLAQIVLLRPWCSL